MMTIKSLGLALSLALLPDTTIAWQKCTFPDVNWLAFDEGAGKSAAYSVAAMNGDMYSGGYVKGSFALMGITGADSPNAVPADGAAIWGESDSDVQSLYIAKTDSAGSMTQTWFIEGKAIQNGAIVHGGGENNIKSGGGLRAMLDDKHLAVNAEYRIQLTMPDGKVYKQALSDSFAKNPDAQVPVVIKLDTTSVNGTGPGTTGWSKEMDQGCPGGAVVHSVDGDTAGNMILSYQCCQDFSEILCAQNWDGSCSTDRYGAPVIGRVQDCKEYIAKLSASDGTQVWRTEVPTGLHACTDDQAGDIYCGFTVRAKWGTASWPFGTYTITTTNTSAVTFAVVVYKADGAVKWAKKSDANSDFVDLDVSRDGEMLAVVGGCGCSGEPAKATRINTTDGSKIWEDSGGIGTHGFRQVAVTDDHQVVAFGQVNTEGTKNELTLTDSTGGKTNVRTSGSYDVFVLAYTPDGVGEWVMDGGGSGVEYFLALAVQPTGNTLYVGGYSRSKEMRWGGVTYDNPMANGDQNSPSGSNKAQTVKITWSGTRPDCLSACDSDTGVVASDVKTGSCYIDNYCYTNGYASPYAGLECFKCDSAVDKLEWNFEAPSSDYCIITQYGRTGPVGKECVKNHEHPSVYVHPTGYKTDYCSACNVTASTTSYSAVPGCKLNVANFPGPPSSPGSAAPYSEITVPMASAAFEPLCYHSDGSPTNMTSDQCQTEHSELQVCNANEAKWPSSQCQADHNALQACNAKDCMDSTVAIALIVVVSVTLGLVLVMLAVVVSKERSGNPLFAPLNSGPPQSQSAGSNTKDNF
jgi:hypothetical protein